MFKSILAQKILYFMQQLIISNFRIISRILPVSFYDTCSAPCYHTGSLDCISSILNEDYFTENVKEVKKYQLPGKNRRILSIQKIAGCPNKVFGEKWYEFSRGSRLVKFKKKAILIAYTKNSQGADI